MHFQGFSCSRVRHIPDNQEVWADDADCSIVVEILEYQSDVPDDKAMAFFWSDLAEVNEAESEGCSTVDAVETIPDSAMPHLPPLDADAPSDIVSGSAAAPSVSKLGLVGRQRVAKFREAARNSVRIYMTALRIPSKTTDILIHINVPLAVDEASSSSSLFPKDTPAEALDAAGLRTMQRVLASLSIKDWGLFCV